MPSSSSSTYIAYNVGLLRRSKPHGAEDGQRLEVRKSPQRSQHAADACCKHRADPLKTNTDQPIKKKKNRYS